jgi:hypothetical protein
LVLASIEHLWAYWAPRPCSCRIWSLLSFKNGIAAMPCISPTLLRGIAF